MAGFRRRDEDTVVIEGKVQHTTAKAWLVELTLGGEVWLPKSQVVNKSDPDFDGNCEFEITEWIAKQNNLK
mgnify:CR=1 FL=1